MEKNQAEKRGSPVDVKLLRKVDVELLREAVKKENVVELKKANSGDVNSSNHIKYNYS
jgi:hypothetical protein